MTALSAFGGKRCVSPPALNLYNLPPTQSRKAFAKAAQDAPHKRRTHYKSDCAIARQ
ncbi:MAG: hypothetical protein MR364_06870 [Oscillospiraceae bacterium]|nr:hypothetical protein [Oscillospiraceae bacterium]